MRGGSACHWHTARSVNQSCRHSPLARLPITRSLHTLYPPGIQRAQCLCVKECMGECVGLEEALEGCCIIPGSAAEELRKRTLPLLQQRPTACALSCFALHALLLLSHHHYNHHHPPPLSLPNWPSLTCGRLVILTLSFATRFCATALHPFRQDSNHQPAPSAA